MTLMTIESGINNITFITYFDASNCRMLDSDHLEQLSIACPNLQRLELCGNLICLSDLQGLRSLASNCKNFQGLNLHEIRDSYGCDRLQL